MDVKQAGGVSPQNRTTQQAHEQNDTPNERLQTQDSSNEQNGSSPLQGNDANRSAAQNLEPSQGQGSIGVISPDQANNENMSLSVADTHLESDIYIASLEAQQISPQGQIAVEGFVNELCETLEVTPAELYSAEHFIDLQGELEQQEAQTLLTNLFMNMPLRDLDRSLAHFILEALPQESQGYVQAHDNLSINQLMAQEHMDSLSEAALADLKELWATRPWLTVAGVTAAIGAAGYVVYSSGTQGLRDMGITPQVVFPWLGGRLEHTLTVDLAPEFEKPVIALDNSFEVTEDVNIYNLNRWSQEHGIELASIQLLTEAGLDINAAYTNEPISQDHPDGLHAPGYTGNVIIPTGEKDNIHVHVTGDFSSEQELNGLEHQLGITQNGLLFDFQHQYATADDLHSFGLHSTIPFSDQHQMTAGLVLTPQVWERFSAQLGYAYTAEQELRLNTYFDSLDLGLAGMSFGGSLSTANIPVAGLTSSFAADWNFADNGGKNGSSLGGNQSLPVLTINLNSEDLLIDGLNLGSTYTGNLPIDEHILGLEAGWQMSDHGSLALSYNNTLSNQDSWSLEGSFTLHDPDNGIQLSLGAELFFNDPSERNYQANLSIVLQDPFFGPRRDENSASLENERNITAAQVDELSDAYRALRVNQDYAQAIEELNTFIAEQDSSPHLPVARMLLAESMYHRAMQDYPPNSQMLDNARTMLQEQLGDLPENLENSVIAMDARYQLGDIEEVLQRHPLGEYLENLESQETG